MAFDQEVRRGHRVGARVVVLPKHLHGSLLVVGSDPVLGFRQHAAGAAGRVADGHDHAGLRQHLRVGLQQQVHHQLNHLARGEVIARCLVGGFVEAPDQVFEHQPHGDVVDPVRMKVDLAELGDDLVEPVGLFQFLDLFLELEAFEDFADVFGEPVDVIGEMPGDIIGISLELGEVKLAVIVEAQRNPLLILG